MTQLEALNIDFNEKFPHLPKAPITEAVIEIRGKASLPWDEKTILEKLKTELPDYPKQKSGRVQQFEVNPEKEQKVIVRDLGWQGLDITSTDQKYISKFNMNFFSLSRLAPYENWDRFKDEMKRLWNIHYKLAVPLEIQRLGVRFINRIEIPDESVHLRDYFQGFSSGIPAIKLDLNGFLHHDIFTVPNYSYMMNIIKTIQPKTPTNNRALILDIDVFTQQPIEANDDIIDKKLSDLHWLKNKIFFSIITPQLITQLK